MGRIRTKEEHSCRYPSDWQRAELIGEFSLIIFESWLNPLWEPTWIVFESASLNNSQGHLGASCSNIGRIRTKENIAVGTLLIGNAKATGGYMIVFES